MNYRREIDGLRALAVIPVILFHAGFQTFSGGFSGVDVFFVISGYLITSIILTEQQAGTFTLLNFYERRARRILPALFVVLLACLPFAWFGLYRNDLDQFSASLVSVTTFISNFYFWRSSSYFDTASELKPLLHTWSLAVEEQYYLLFPVFLMLVRKAGTRWIVSLLAAVAISSLCLAQWASSNTPSLNFYLLPTRFWELLTGGFIAYYFCWRPQAEHGKAVSQFGSALGLALIVYSMLAFDIRTPFPSFYTLAPTLGASLIILFATHETLVGKVLGSKWAVGMGLVSYSAYLWHHPLFAFVRYENVDEPPHWLMAILSVIAIALAYFSWKYIETPFRKKRFSRRTIFISSLAGLLFFAFSGYALPRLKTTYPLTVEEQKIYAYMSYDFAGETRRNICFLDSATQGPSSFPDECNKIDTKMPTLLLWGDSHAAALSVGLRSLHGNVIQYTADSCPPIVGRDFVTARYCSAINHFVLDEIARIKPNDVVMDAYWYAYGNRISLLSSTLEAVHNASPSSRITLVGNVPVWPGSLPLLMLKHRIPFENPIYVRLSSYQNLKSLDAKLQALTEIKGAHFVSALEVFCKDELCQATTLEDGALALTTFDYAHLTKAASRQLARHLMESGTGK
jgi:peptidoglycan/LPS O-acetylase OafA/YrhL